MVAKKVVNMENSNIDAIHHVVRDIYHLQIEKHELSHRVSLVDKAILRKFSIIDAIAHAKKLSDQEQSTIKKMSLEKYMVLGTQENTYKEGSLTVSDKLISIHALSMFSRRPDAFHHYQRLPPETRERILKELDSGQDRLNVAYAIPVSCELLGWQHNSLQLEAVFPLLAHLGVINFRTILNLQMVSKGLFKTVKQTFLEQVCKNKDSLHAYVCQLEKHIRPTIIDLNKCQIPFTVQINLDFANKSSILKQKKALMKIGKLVLDCVIVLRRISDFGAELEMFNLLALLPNLKRLKICHKKNLVPWQRRNHSQGNEEDTDESSEELVELDGPHQYKANTGFNAQKRNCSLFGNALPLLSKLQLLYLELSGDLFGFFNKLTNVVGKNIINVVVIHRNPTGNLYLLNFPYLSQVSFETVGGSIDNVLKFLTACKGRSLKCIQISGVALKRDLCIQTCSFSAIMRLVAGFKDTLQELHIYMDMFFESSDLDLYGDNLWIAEFTFPVLKTLFLGNHPGMWCFLLLCPSLETLALDNVWVDESSFFANSQQLQLSWDKKQMMQSNVWEYLPCLNSINFSRRVKQVLVEEFTVTKSQFSLQKKMKCSVPENPCWLYTHTIFKTITSWICKFFGVVKKLLKLAIRHVFV